jgi:hypothetical protein
VKAIHSELSMEPAHLAIVLQKFDGGMHYMDTFIGLSVAEIGKFGSSLNTDSYTLLPFAKDIEGNLQCIKREGSSGPETVVNFDPNESSIDEDLKLTYGKYIEMIRDNLLLKKVVYEEGLGLVEVQ